ncbi:MAG TPA: glycosyltransferase [Flavisolibacter sp.]|nr:glycosyltransferase [Flavisolibacter sp.]
MLLVVIVFLLAYALLIRYYRKGWDSLSGYRAPGNDARVFVSIIVPARNEEKAIIPLLHALSHQHYPASLFEVIVVDDFSTDDTAGSVALHAAANVRLIKPAADARHSSKKKAIEAGIAAAKGELIVTTDADCLPPVSWLRTLADFYAEKGASFIAAPVKFSYDGSWLQKFQALDFLTLQGITAASVATGFHTMCNGANLAYRKQAFVDVDGFAGIDRVATGDDMLLMYKIWKKDPSRVFYLKSRDAVMSTTPMTTLRGFIMQRKRWASKTLVYDDRRILAVLAFVYLLNLLFPLLLVWAFFNIQFLLLAAGFWVTKTLIEWPFINAVAAFYRERKLMRLFFWFQPLHMLYTVFVGLLSQFGRYEWKGRRTK